MTLLTILLFLLIGISLGLIGGGGSILSVPILVYVLGFEEKTAIATSLLVITVTSAAAAAQHARAGNVRWRVVLVFSAAGMAGAFAGGHLARFVPGAVLLILFAGIMLAAAVAMWRSASSARGSSQSEAQPQLLPFVVLRHGFAVGLLTGLVGAGGGFLIVPTLALLFRLPMHQAIGSSLVVIALKSVAGFLGYLSHVQVDFQFVALDSACAMAGSILGARLGAGLSGNALRRGFAVFVFIMALAILYVEAPTYLAQLLTD